VSAAAEEGHVHGEYGDEAVRLIALGQEWAQRAFSSTSGEVPAGDCAWCPVCQLAAVIRGERPEATAKVLAAGNLLIAGLRTLLDGLTSAGADASSARDASSTAAEPQPSEPRVQRIDLGQG
jgi:hypothetical protein